MDEIVARILRRSHWVRNLHREGLERAWMRAAGEKLAARARVTHFKDGVLTIEVTSAAQKYELEAFRAAPLLARLQSDAEAPAVRRLAFRLGHGES